MFVVFAGLGGVCNLRLLFVLEVAVWWSWLWLEVVMLFAGSGAGCWL
jgi:hypothetical protein